MHTSVNTRLTTEQVDFGRARSAELIAAWPLPPERLAEVELERAAWSEIIALTERLTSDERRAPGYFLDPPWSVKDLLGHLAAWHAEAREQLLDIGAKAYLPHDSDVDRRNTEILRRLRDQPWDSVREQATGARAWMLEAWYGLHDPDDDAAEWVRKAGAEHYAEHYAVTDEQN
jgi:hypothetical protein